MFGQLASLSLGLAVTRNVSYWRDKNERRLDSIVKAAVGLGVTTSSVAVLAMCFCSAYLVNVWFKAPELLIPMRWSAFVLQLTAINGILSGIQAGLERFGIRAVVTVIQNAAILIGCVLAAPLLGLTGVIIAYAIGMAISAIFSVHSLRDVFFRSTGSRDISRAARDLTLFCGPTVLGGVILMFASWAATVLVARSPDGYEQVAYFSAADRLRAVQLFAASLIASALLPIVTNTLGQARQCPQQDQEIIQTSICVTAMLIVSVATVLVFAGPNLMAAYGRGYSDKWPMLLAMIAWGAVAGSTSTVAMALYAHGTLWAVCTAQAVAGIVLVGVAFGLRNSGALGLASAQLISAAVVLAAVVRIAVRHDVITKKSTCICLCTPLYVFILCGLGMICPAQLRLALVGPATLASIAISYVTLTNRGQRSAVADVLRSFTRNRTANVALGAHPAHKTGG
jgi:O-antigen/teichoic acid export membrane protein